MATEIISAVLQVLVFALIPFLVFVISKKTAKGFLEYLGLKRTTRKAIVLAFIISLIFFAGGIGLALISEDIKQVMLSPESVSGKIHSLGFNTESVIILLVTAWIKTAFAEEVLFRGFVAKRLIKVLGYIRGNLLQSFIFGLIHLLLFWLVMGAGISFLAFTFFLSGITAYLIAFINEKRGGGSILPGWIAHGLGNTLSYSIFGYFISS